MLHCGIKKQSVEASMCKIERKSNWVSAFNYLILLLITTLIGGLLNSCNYESYDNSKTTSPELSSLAFSAATYVVPREEYSLPNSNRRVPNNRLLCFAPCRSFAPLAFRLILDPTSVSILHGFSSWTLALLACLTLLGSHTI
jgi:hypothetical protein